MVTDTEAGANLLTLREVAEILGVSVPRVYQMDDVLRPIVSRQGNRRKVRHYRPDVVERVKQDRCDSEPGLEMPTERLLWRRARRQALSRGVGFDVDFDQFEHVAQMSCMFCNTPPKNRDVGRGRMIAMHNVVRIVHDQGFDYNNIAPCCPRCLVIKGDMDARTFVTYCRTVVAWHARLRVF
jgi:5-methylcytosine-specific restriction endonuclease McrA